MAISVNQNGHFEEMGAWLHCFTYYLTHMTALGPSSYGSPNVLQDLEFWEKFESNLLVCHGNLFLGAFVLGCSFPAIFDLITMTFWRQLMNSWGTDRMLVRRKETSYLDCLSFRVLQASTKQVFRSSCAYCLPSLAW